MEESDIRAPLYYVLGRDTTENTLSAVRVAFAITPIYSGVVSRLADKGLIQPFVMEVLHASDESACKELTAHVARVSRCPVLTVGDGEDLTAVYPDGGEEKICWSKPTSMS